MGMCGCTLLGIATEELHSLPATTQYYCHKEVVAETFKNIIPENKNQHPTPSVTLTHTSGGHFGDVPVTAALINILSNKPMLPEKIKKKTCAYL